MVKLVLYTENYFPGGLERFICDLIGSKIFDVHIVVNSENSRIIEFAISENIPYEVVKLSQFKLTQSVNNTYNKFVKVMNFFGHYLSILPNYFILKRHLKRVVNYENILIINGGYPAALSTLVASVASKKLGFNKVGLSILSSISPNYKNSVFKYFQIKIDKIVAQYIDFYIPNSNQIKGELIDALKIEKSKIFTIYTGVDIPTNTARLSELKTNESLIIKQNNEIWLTMVALLGSTKRQDILIDSLGKLNKNIKLLLVGDGPNRIFLERKTSELGLDDRVVFTGWIKDPSDIYRFADVLVFASNQEGLPYSISEAMSYKIPIIASSVGGIVEQIVHNKGGLLFSNEIDDLVKQINKMCESDAIRENFAQYSFERVKDFFSLDVMNKQILDLYKNKIE